MLASEFEVLYNRYLAGSEVVSQLATKVRPRYHVCGGKDVSYARQPYLNKDLGAGEYPTVLAILTKKIKSVLTSDLDSAQLSKCLMQTCKCFPYVETWQHAAGCVSSNQSTCCFCCCRQPCDKIYSAGICRQPSQSQEPARAGAQAGI